MENENTVFDVFERVKDRYGVDIVHYLLLDGSFSLINTDEHELTRINISQHNPEGISLDIDSDVLLFKEPESITAVLQNGSSEHTYVWPNADELFDAIVESAKL